MGLNVGATPAKEIRVGSAPALGVYVGANKVWPVGSVYVETFDATIAAGGGWTNFVNQGDMWGTYQAGGKAGQPTKADSNEPQGYYANAGLLTDSHYLDVTLGAPLAFNASTGSQQPLRLHMRRQAALNSGKWAQFALIPNGDVEIWTYNGGSGTRKVRGTGKGIAAGKIYRCITQANGYCAIYDRTAGLPGTLLTSWTDSAKSELVYNNPAYRYAGMRQTMADVFLQGTFVCHAVDRWEYGDLPASELMRDPLPMPVGA